MSKFVGGSSEGMALIRSLDKKEIENADTPLNNLVAAIELAEVLPRDDNGFLTDTGRDVVTRAYGSVRSESTKPKVNPSPFRGRKSLLFDVKAFVQKIDKRGRRYCMDNGKRVSCGFEEPKTEKEPKQEKPVEKPTPKKKQDQEEARKQVQQLQDKLKKGEPLSDEERQNLPALLSSLTVVDLKKIAANLDVLNKKAKLKAEHVQALIDFASSVVKKEPEPEPIKPVEVKPAEGVREVEPPKIEAKPVEKPKEEEKKPVLDWKQRDPDNPVAKSLREDKEVVDLMEKIASGGSIKQKIKKLNHQYYVHLEAIKVAEEKYGKDSDVVRVARKKFLDTAREYGNAQAIEDQEIEKGRKLLVELMKPKSPPQFKMEKHKGNSILKNFLFGAIAGQGLGTALGGMTMGVGTVAGAIMGGITSAIVRRVKPFEAEEREQKQVDDAFSFVSSVCEWPKDKKANVVVGRSSDLRAYYSDVGAEGSKTPTVMIGYDPSHKGGVKTMVHELGHMIEYQKPSARAKIVAFQQYRTKGDKEVDMADIPGGKEMKGEKGIPDDFGRHFDPVSAAYVGKTYKRGKEISTEVLSMGIEALYADPAGFISDDPEYAALVISVLRSKD